MLTYEQILVATCIGISLGMILGSLIITIFQALFYRINEKKIKGKEAV